MQSNRHWTIHIAEERVAYDRHSFKRIENSDKRVLWPADNFEPHDAKGCFEKKEMSDEELKAELERLRQENAALKKGAAAGIRMKVSEKGAVSIYGMGRFPVTLYKEQWLKLLDMSDDIRAFIAANEAQLKTKNQNK